MNFNKELTAFLKAQGITKAELANRLGTSRANIYSITNPSLSTLQRIWKAVGCRFVIGGDVRVELDGDIEVVKYVVQGAGAPKDYDREMDALEFIDGLISSQGTRIERHVLIRGEWVVDLSYRGISI